MIKRFYSYLLSGFLVLAGSAIAVHAADSYTVTPDSDSEVVFTSKAPGETFHGKSKKISGTITFDPADLDMVSGKLTVPVASLDTGIKLRNNHMMENHLHPDKFPEIVFVPKKILSPSASSFSGADVSGKIQGEFTLHGVTKTIEPDFEATYEKSSGILSVKVNFMVNLNDFEIPRPQFLFMKLAENQAVEVTLKAAKQ